VDPRRKVRPQVQISQIGVLIGEICAIWILLCESVPIDANLWILEEKEDPQITQISQIAGC
jgi:hypothetical protein